ncbi:MAG: hypothetical protein JWM78_2912 [Verrucomicrobiaceae bacterium]|nr:hypothetical protein [Verrucomicrobiaceae bacterium]
MTAKMVRAQTDKQSARKDLTVGELRVVMKAVSSKAAANVKSVDSALMRGLRDEIQAAVNRAKAARE